MEGAVPNHQPLVRPHAGRDERGLPRRPLDGDLLEFVMAVDAYKQANGRRFLRNSEIYDLMLFLGYRKVAPRLNHIADVEQVRQAAVARSAS